MCFTDEPHVRLFMPTDIGRIWTKYVLAYIYCFTYYFVNDKSYIEQSLRAKAKKEEPFLTLENNTYLE